MWLILDFFVVGNVIRYSILLHVVKSVTIRKMKVSKYNQFSTYLYEVSLWHIKNLGSIVTPLRFSSRQITPNEVSDTRFLTSTRWEMSILRYHQYSRLTHLISLLILPKIRRHYKENSSNLVTLANTKKPWNNTHENMKTPTSSTTPTKKGSPWWQKIAQN